MNLEKTAFDSNALQNLQGAMGNVVGAGQTFIEALENQKQLNEAMGKSSQFSDQLAIALARADQKMLEFSSTLANSRAEGERSIEESYRTATSNLQFERGRGKALQSPEGKALAGNRFQNQLGAQSNKDLSNFCRTAI